MTTALLPLDALSRATGIVIDAPIDPLGGRVRVALGLAAAMVVTTTAAATLMPIQGAVVGSGQIDLESSVKTIAHPSGGTIAAILVHNGEHVRKGQPLLRLDDVVTSSDAQMASLSVAQLRARKARLSAQASGAGTITFPADLLASADPATREALSDERMQFAAGRAEEASMVSQSEARAAEYAQQLAGFQTQVAALRTQSKLIDPERAAMASLYDRKLVTISRYNQMERTAADISGNIANLNTEMAGARARIAEARAQIGQIRATRRSDAGDKLAQVTDLLGQQRARTASATDLQDRTVIRAPYDGIVDKLALATIGGVIRPAEPIVSIVPDRDARIVTASIKPEDVDRVAVGQPARVRLSALSVTATPEIAGRVTYVGANRVTDPDTHQAYYQVRVALDPVAVRKADLPLRAGMPAELYLATGSRSMLSYLLKPLTDQFARAFTDS